LAGVFLNKISGGGAESVAGGFLYGGTLAQLARLVIGHRIVPQGALPQHLCRQLPGGG
jgi:hypothetical protein